MPIPVDPPVTPPGPRQAALDRIWAYVTADKRPTKKQLLAALEGTSPSR